jgi:hypothetical protein
MEARVPMFVAKQDWDSLRQEGPAAVDLLVSWLKDDDERVRHAVTEALGRLGSIAVEPLIACLKDESAAMRQSAALALGRLGDARAAAPLTACLKDEDEAVQQQAARALKEAELKPFIEKGTQLLDVASADLNGDGTIDHILVLEKQNEEPDERDYYEEHLRPLPILIRHAAGALKLVKRNDKIPTTTGTFSGVSVTTGAKTFTVEQSGSYLDGQTWSKAYTFNYSRIDKTWQLVRVVEFEGARTADTNEYTEVYTPPKDYGKTDIADFDPENYLGKGER